MVCTPNSATIKTKLPLKIWIWFWEFPLFRRFNPRWFSSYVGNFLCLRVTSNSFYKGHKTWSLSDILPSHHCVTLSFWQFYVHMHVLSLSSCERGHTLRVCPQANPPSPKFGFLGLWAPKNPRQTAWRPSPNLDFLLAEAGGGDKISKFRPWQNMAVKTSMLPSSARRRENPTSLPHCLTTQVRPTSIIYSNKIMPSFPTLISLPFDNDSNNNS